MADDKDTKQEQKDEAQADLELEVKDAEEVKAGAKHFFGGADRGPDVKRNPRF